MPPSADSLSVLVLDGKRDLKYIHQYVDKNGKGRAYFRRPGARRVPLFGKPGSNQFRAEYAAAVKQPVLLFKRGEKRPAPIPKPDHPDSAVYFVRSGDFIKIGYAKNIPNRMAELRVGSPYKLTLLVTVPGGRSVEREFHQRFAKLRMRGEWFKAGAELTDFIQSQRTKARRSDGYSKKTVG